MSVSKEQIKKNVEEAIAKGCGNPIYSIQLTVEIRPYITPDGKAMDWPDSGLNYMGFYYTLDEAIDAMNNNELDIAECCFNYGYITVGFPGVYNDSSGWYNRMFFKWDEDRKGFFECGNEPEIMKHISI